MNIPPLAFWLILFVGACTGQALRLIYLLLDGDDHGVPDELIADPKPADTDLATLAGHIEALAAELESLADEPIPSVDGDPVVALAIQAGILNSAKYLRHRASGHRAVAAFDERVRSAA